MNGYDFTERLRRVLAYAKDEAINLNHEYVGTEHLLLGLIREGEGIAAAALTNLGVNLDVLRARVHATVVTGSRENTAGSELPFTDDNVLLDTRASGSANTPPAVLWDEPVAPHSLENVGLTPLHIVSVELKS